MKWIFLQKSHSKLAYIVKFPEFGHFRQNSCTFFRFYFVLSRFLLTETYNVIRPTFPYIDISDRDLYAESP